MRVLLAVLALIVAPTQQGCAEVAPVGALDQSGLPLPFPPL
ncbi:hypothetical protein [Methylocapsa aurea]|nr:hypothetical protein [Methylocapsa aurea]